MLVRLGGRSQVVHLDGGSDGGGRSAADAVLESAAAVRDGEGINCASVGYNSNRDRMVLWWKGSSWALGRLLLRLLGVFLLLGDLHLHRHHHRRGDHLGPRLLLLDLRQRLRLLLLRLM